MKAGWKFPIDVRGQRSGFGERLKTKERKQKLNNTLLSITVYRMSERQHFWPSEVYKNKVDTFLFTGLTVLPSLLDWAEIVSWKSSASEDLAVSMRLHFVGFCKVFVYLARQTDGWDFRSDPSCRPTKLWSESLVRRPEKSTLHEERGGQALEVKTRLQQWCCRNGTLSNMKKNKMFVFTQTFFGMNSVKSQMFSFYLFIIFMLDLRIVPSIHRSKRKAREKKKHRCITHWAEQVAGVMRLFYSPH